MSTTIISRIDSIEKTVDTHWLIYCATLVFFMQCGFAMLEAGSVRSKNTKNILFKNMLDACVGAILWWFLGHAFAYDAGNGFIGFPDNSLFVKDYAGSNEDSHGMTWALWFFQYVFAATSATIVSGAVAERATIISYIIYTSFMTLFIYPIVVHWVWSSDGWLSSFNSNAPLKVMDFAGSGVVHMTGGVAGLWGAYIIGPRQQRFENPIEGHSSVLQVLGTLILWLGWYGFNSGSTLGLAPTNYARDAARVTVTTTLAAASSGITSSLITYYVSHKWLPENVCNGIIAGLVSITAGCSVTHPWHAFIIGIIGSILYLLTSKLLIKLKIDDPLDVFAVHGVCGIWGVISTGLFAVPSLSYNGSCGLFYGCHETILASLAAVSVQFLWVSSLSILMFYTLKYLSLLRITSEEEQQGLDISKHGGSAYNVA